MGYKQSDDNSEGMTILLVYVDDIIITGNDNIEAYNLSQQLSKMLEIKSLGRLRYFLGIEVASSEHGIFISQQKYILNLLQEAGKTMCKPSNTLMDPNLTLGTCDEDSQVNKE